MNYSKNPRLLSKMTKKPFEKSENLINSYSPIAVCFLTYCLFLRPIVYFSDLLCISQTYCVFIRPIVYFSDLLYIS